MAAEIKPKPVIGMLHELKPIPGAVGEGLTDEEFRAIEGLAVVPVVLGNNTPPPIVYQEAVRALAACRSLDEAKYWDNKADALAAWAKIYADDTVQREARALKLHAYRRMGQLADSLRIQAPRGTLRGGTTKGSHSLLQEHGISKDKATQMLRLGRASEERFAALTDANRPPSPSVATGLKLRPNPAWAILRNKMAILMSAARRTNPKEIVATLTAKEIESADAIYNDLIEWLDLFGGAIEQRQLSESE